MRNPPCNFHHNRYRMMIDMSCYILPYMNFCNWKNNYLRNLYIRFLSTSPYR